MAGDKKKKRTAADIEAEIFSGTYRSPVVEPTAATDELGPVFGQSDGGPPMVEAGSGYGPLRPGETTEWTGRGPARVFAEEAANTYFLDAPALGMAAGRALTEEPTGPGGRLAEIRRRKSDVERERSLAATANRSNEIAALLGLTAGVIAPLPGGARPGVALRPAKWAAKKPLSALADYGDKIASRADRSVKTWARQSASTKALGRAEVRAAEAGSGAASAQAKLATVQADLARAEQRLEVATEAAARSKEEASRIIAGSMGDPKLRQQATNAGMEARAKRLEVADAQADLAKARARAAELEAEVAGRRGKLRVQGSAEKGSRRAGKRPEQIGLMQEVERTQQGLASKKGRVRMVRWAGQETAKLASKVRRVMDRNPRAAEQVRSRLGNLRGWEQEAALKALVQAWESDPEFSLEMDKVDSEDLANFPGYDTGLR